MTAQEIETRPEDDALILQQKEAGPSVLTLYAARRDHASQAERVVVC